RLAYTRIGRLLSRALARPGRFSAATRPWCAADFRSITIRRGARARRVFGRTLPFSPRATSSSSVVAQCLLHPVIPRHAARAAPSRASLTDFKFLTLRRLFPPLVVHISTNRETSGKERLRSTTPTSSGSCPATSCSPLATPVRVATTSSSPVTPWTRTVLRVAAQLVVTPSVVPPVGLLSYRPTLRRTSTPFWN